MLIVIDTEFTGLDQRQPKLISLGLVDETGRSFYAEFPPIDYRHECSDWVVDNVLPLLWGGEHILPEVLFKARLRAWIEEIGDRAMFVTDSPDFDFELVKPLLNPWPRNLASAPLRFDITASRIGLRGSSLDTIRLSALNIMPCMMPLPCVKDCSRHWKEAGGRNDLVPGF